MLIDLKKRKIEGIVLTKLHKKSYVVHSKPHQERQTQKHSHVLHKQYDCKHYHHSLGKIGLEDST